MCVGFEEKIVRMLHEFELQGTTREWRQLYNKGLCSVPRQKLLDLSHQAQVLWGRRKFCYTHGGC
jgi:hypothetical protein